MNNRREHTRRQHQRILVWNERRSEYARRRVQKSTEELHLAYFNCQMAFLGLVATLLIAFMIIAPLGE